MKILAGLVLAMFALGSHAGDLYQFDCNAPTYQPCEWPDLKITLSVDPLPGQHLPGPYDHAHDRPIAWVEVQWAGFPQIRFDRDLGLEESDDLLGTQFANSTRFPGELEFRVAGARFGEPNPFREPILILDLVIRRGISDLLVEPAPLEQVWNTPFSIAVSLRDNVFADPYFTHSARGGAVLFVEERSKVPETGTLSLLSLGLLGLLFFCRRKRNEISARRAVEAELGRFGAR